VPTARRVLPLLVGLVVFYALVLGQRGWILLTGGRPAFVLLGVGVLVLPVLGLALVARELAFGRSMQALARDLAAQGHRPPDGLPRRPSGRVDRAGADAVFDRRRAEVEAAPADWRAWFRLALAYDDAGDRPRARSAMRHAVALHRGGPASGQR
jgi:hypothetical protein